MQITVKLHGHLKNSFRRKEITTTVDEDHGKVVDVILNLIEQEGMKTNDTRIIVHDESTENHENARKLNPGILLLVNDVDARLLGGLSAPVNDGDVITLLPSIHGG